MLPSTDNQVRHRAHNRTKVIQIYIFFTHSQWESAQGTLLKKAAQQNCSKNLPHVSSALHLNQPTHTTKTVPKPTRISPQ